MQLILLQNVQNLGKLGDKVTVKPGFGRNYLIPYGKAAPATAANLAEFEARRAEYEAKAKAALHFDDRLVAEGTGAAVLGNPLDALTWLANHLSARGYGLKSGDAVTTGTVASIHFAEAAMRVTADFGPIGRVELRFK